MVDVRFFLAKSSFLMSRQISTTRASLWSAFTLISFMCPFSSWAGTRLRVSARRAHTRVAWRARGAPQ